ncbi:hypothetical protein Vadar_025837 [Vaccinium darrowii]|nr:hypothetical protein Vadar_025837 [Vaccinium darrowii]
MDALRSSLERKINSFPSFNSLFLLLRPSPFSRTELRTKPLPQLRPEGKVVSNAKRNSWRTSCNNMFVPPDWRKLPSRMAEVLWQSIQVRFNLHEEWHREMDFVKEKTSADFKIKSDHFKEMRQIQLPLQHTMSRKGYARLADEMKGESKISSISRAKVWAEGHKKKNGQPSNTIVKEKIDDMEKIERDTPNLFSTNLNEDAVSKVLGAEKRGRLRTFGKGVTKTKLAILSQMSGHFSQLHEENMQLKSQMALMQNSIDELKRNQVHHPATTSQTTPVVSPSSINTHSNSNKCKLLHWMGTGEIVAEGHWSSSDPMALVHHIPIGPNAMRVWVEAATKPDEYLWRTTSDMEFIKDAVGTTVAWPADKVLMDSMQGSTIG